MIGLLSAAAVHAGTSDGKHYTNFGLDLVTPIFPVDGSLRLFKNKSDAQPSTVLRGVSTALLEGDWKACVRTTAADGWVRCNVGGKKGWVKRSEFRSGGEYAPPAAWPFRYWIYIADTGQGAEGSVLMQQLARRSPYLVAPAEYENIFFHVLFDEQGNALGSKTRKPTGDRVFLVGNAAYLAPADPQKRDGATWLFLNYYNAQLSALCPAQNPDSCMSAVNLAPGWPGIKAMYQQPPERFRQGDDVRWFGAGEVAFARHADPVSPLMYRVPDDVYMRVDGSSATDSQREKNRAKPFCIADCGKP